MTDLASLVRGVTLLSLDAGNTVVFFDHARLASFLTERGFASDVTLLRRAEGESKRRHAAGTMLDIVWARRELPGARSWGAYVGNMIAAAGVAKAALPALMNELWDEHVRLNLWSQVPDGFGEAVERARATGVKTVVVSNSEGKLAALFEAIGIAHHFDLLLDSAVVGFEKPHPRMFEVALERTATPADAALHLGDVYSTDVVGARSVHMRAALIDPFGHYDGQYSDVPRVPGVVEVALALAAARA